MRKGRCREKGWKCVEESVHLGEYNRESYVALSSEIIRGRLLGNPMRHGRQIGLESLRIRKARNRRPRRRHDLNYLSDAAVAYIAGLEEESYTSTYGAPRAVEDGKISGHAIRQRRTVG